MSCKTKTIEEITCDVCAKVTPENFASFEVRVSRTTDVVDVFSVSLSGRIGYGGPVNDLCFDCARQHLALALKKFDPLVLKG